MKKDLIILKVLFMIAAINAYLIKEVNGDFIIMVYIAISLFILIVLIHYHKYRMKKEKQKKKS